MPTGMLVKQRVMAAVRGAFIADAASMGTHWIYDPKEMKAAVSDIEKPEFRQPPSPKFYSAEEFPGHYGVGMLSPYGEQLLFVTEHVAGTMEEDLSGETMSKAMREWANSFGGRPDSAMKAFLENMEKEEGQWPKCGADDNQAHFYMKVIPVVGRYAGSPELVDKVTLAIKVHQNNDEAIAFGIASARLLEALILGASLTDALATVESNISDDLATSKSKDEVLKAFARSKKISEEGDLDTLLLHVSHEMMAGKEDSPFYHLFGRSCALPGSFIGPMALFYKYASSPPLEIYAPALRENILGSGDTCSRAIFVGAVLAAAGVKSEGDNAIPSDWADKMDAGTTKKIEAALESIARKIESEK